MEQLNEALNLSTIENVRTAFQTNSVGEKLPAELRSYADTDNFTQDVAEYFNSAERESADKTKTIQMAIKVAAHSEDPIQNFHLWSTREFCPNLAKYSQTEWLKQNPLYQGLSDKTKKYTRSDFEDLRGFMRSESLKHGKNTKGSGRNNDVKVLYKDANWILLVPANFDAEKKIAYFTNPQGEKEKCHWCTASSISFYNSYSYNNTKPLYVMINKEDHAWQLAYCPTKHHVEFLNEYDDPDSFTRGLWSDVLPREMQAKIVNEFNGKSLLDFTLAKEAPKEPSEDEFVTKFLPFIEISGKHSVSVKSFDTFMLEDEIAPVDTTLDLFVRIKTKPNLYMKFAINNNGPVFTSNDYKSLNKLEKRVVELALFQYAAETFELDVDYTAKFDVALNNLKESLKSGE
jgi:hypothetical protein